jgi:hypothetical protein
MVFPVGQKSSGFFVIQAVYMFFYFRKNKTVFQVQMRLELFYNDDGF